MTTSAQPQVARVIAMPVRRVDPNTIEALLQLAQRRAAWNRAHPHATDDEQLDAWAEIAEELGL